MKQVSLYIFWFIPINSQVLTMKKHESSKPKSLYTCEVVTYTMVGVILCQTVNTFLD